MILLPCLFLKKVTKGISNQNPGEDAVSHRLIGGGAQAKFVSLFVLSHAMRILYSTLFRSTEDNTKRCSQTVYAFGYERNGALM